MKGEKVLYDETEFPTYRIEYEASDYRVEFKVFEVQSAYGTEPPYEIAEEELALSGEVKWDGCSNWDYMTKECMAHYCGVTGIKRFGDMQVHLYEMAAELLASLGTTYPAENRGDFFV